METLIITGVVSFITGWCLSYLFNKYVKVDIHLVNVPVIKNTTNNSLPKEIKDIQTLLNEVKKGNNLNISLSPVVLRSLQDIAKTRHWYKKVDTDTINNLHKIYEKWQRSINKSATQSVTKISESGGFEKPEYWEGTQEEFEQACKNGIIKENTIVSIITDDKDYRGSWITIDENGEISEYMD